VVIAFRGPTDSRGARRPRPSGDDVRRRIGSYSEIDLLTIPIVGGPNLSIMARLDSRPQKSRSCTNTAATCDDARISERYRPQP